MPSAEKSPPDLWEAVWRYVAPMLKEMPPEFWEHLGRGLQEFGAALRILAETLPDVEQDLWERLYQEMMAGERRLGGNSRFWEVRPPFSSG